MLDIIHSLRRAKGRLAKIEILKAHSDYTEWREFLLAVYDTSINYYVSAPNDTTFIDDHIDWEDLTRDLTLLYSRSVVGKDARRLAVHMSTKHGELSRLILAGSIKAGVSIATINTAYPGLIPTFPVMLAKDVEVVKWPVLASIKFDGVRLLVRVEEGSATGITRNGKVLNIESLNNRMVSLPEGVYDGELVMGEGLQSGRTTITGSVNKVLKGTATDIKGYTFMIFDYLTLNEWDTRISTKDFSVRLLDSISNIDDDDYIRAVRQERLEKPSDMDDMFSSCLESGYEGIMLRYPNDPYVWGRSDTLIKKKAIKECILRCVATLPGKGKYEGKVGALVCTGTLNGQNIMVNVGSGLSEFDREEDPSVYIKKDIEVLYNDMVKNKDSGTYSLFLPRFKRVVSTSIL